MSAKGQDTTSGRRLVLDGIGRSRGGCVLHGQICLCGGSAADRLLAVAERDRNSYRHLLVAQASIHCGVRAAATAASARIMLGPNPIRLQFALSSGRAVPTHRKPPTEPASAATRTLAVLLDGWAWNRSEGAKDATASRLGFKPLSAAHAVVEELAGVSWHGLSGSVATNRTDYCRFTLHGSDAHH